MMTLKSIMVVVGVLCALRMLTACESVEMIFYDHEPSQIFFKEFNIDSTEIEPFIDNEVCHMVFLKAIEYRTEYIVWQGLYTKKNNKWVTIKKAILEGGNYKEETTLNQAVVLDEKIKHADLLRGVVKLFQVKSDLLKKVYQDGGYLRLKVFYEIEGKDGFKQYELKQRIEKHTVFPT